VVVVVLDDVNDFDADDVKSPKPFWFEEEEEEEEEDREGGGRFDDKAKVFFFFFVDEAKNAAALDDDDDSARMTYSIHTTRLKRMRKNASRENSNEKKKRTDPSPHLLIP